MVKKGIMKWSLVAVLVCLGLAVPQGVIAQEDHHDFCLECLLEEGSDTSLTSTPVGESEQATETVYNQVVLPATPTQNEKAKKEEARMDVPRVIAGYLRYETVEVGSTDGDIYGASLGLAWDRDNVSYGFIIPYDNMDFDGVDSDINRFGIVGFFQYNADMTSNWTLGLTVNANWYYGDYDVTSIRVIGGGTSVSFTYDNGGVFVPGLAFSYQYNQDDTAALYNYQHLFKSGLNLGFRIGDAASVNLYGVWNEDISDHMRDVDENDSADVGIEARFNVSDTFTLSGGYKAVVDVEDFDSSTFYFGALFTF